MWKQVKHTIWMVIRCMTERSHSFRACFYVLIFLSWKICHISWLEIVYARYFLVNESSPGCPGCDCSGHHVAFVGDSTMEWLRSCFRRVGYCCAVEKVPIPTFYLSSYAPLCVFTVLSKRCQFPQWLINDDCILWIYQR